MNANPYESPEQQAVVNVRPDVAELSIPQLALKLSLFAAAAVLGVLAIAWLACGIFQTWFVFTVVFQGIDPSFPIYVACKIFGACAIATTLMLSMIWLARRIGGYPFRAVGDISLDDVKAIAAVIRNNAALRGNRLLAVSASGPDEVEARFAGKWCKGVRLRKTDGAWHMVAGGAILEEARS